MPTKLVNFLDKNHLLSKFQHDFRKKHSCESQLIHTLSDLTIFNNQNVHVDVVVLDFSKAFDTVFYGKLVHKLKAFGINPQLLDWI